MQITFTPPLGSPFAITNGTQRKLLVGRNGELSPDFSISELSTPLSGLRLSSVAVRGRDVDLPIQIEGANRADLVAEMRAFLAALNPIKGEGTLSVINDDGEERFLKCVFKSGFTADGYGGLKTGRYAKAVLTFHATDPYWYAATPITDTYTVTPSTATFFPFFPLRLLSSAVFTTDTVTNPGDVDAWPVWTITGPGQDIVLRNITTGEELSIAATLTALDTLIIDTRPFVKTVKLNGVNAFPNVIGAPSLFPLVDGDNDLRVEINNADGSTVVALSFYPRYLSI